MAIFGNYQGKLSENWYWRHNLFFLNSYIFKLGYLMRTDGAK